MTYKNSLLFEICEFASDSFTYRSGEHEKIMQCKISDKNIPSVMDIFLVHSFANNPYTLELFTTQINELIKPAVEYIFLFTNVNPYKYKSNLGEGLASS